MRLDKELTETLQLEKIGSDGLDMRPTVVDRALERTLALGRKVSDQQPGTKKTFNVDMEAATSSVRNNL